MCAGWKSTERLGLKNEIIRERIGNVTKCTNSVENGIIQSRKLSLSLLTNY